MADAVSGMLLPVRDYFPERGLLPDGLRGF